MEGQATSTETERSYPLLWAIDELRTALDRLVGEQKALLLGPGADPVGVVPPSKPAASPALPPVTSAAPVTDPDPPPVRKNPMPGARPRPRDNPPATARGPAAEPAAAFALEPARPEDARQRLDALAAKLLDRRMRQTAADPAARTSEG